MDGAHFRAIFKTNRSRIAETIMSAVPANAVPAALVRRAGSAFAALAAVQVALIASITMLTVALPQLQRQWALSSPALVVVSTSYSVAFGALLLVAGNVADRFGHRRTLLGALAVFAAASVAAAGANGVTMLVAARFAQGVGAAFAVPAAMALIPIVFAGERQRARATALWGGLAATGASVGMVLSGPVVEVSWRWLFAPPGLIAVVAAVMVGRLVPGGLARRPARIDPLCTVLVVAGLTALIYGLGAESVLLAATGAALLIGFAVTQRRSTAPLLPKVTLQTASGLVAILVAGGALASLYYLLTLQLADTGHTPAAISTAFIPPALAALTAGPAAAQLLHRLPARTVLALGLVVAVVGTLLLSRAGPHSGIQLPGLLTAPLGTGIVLSAATVAGMPGADDTQRGPAGGLTNTAMEIGPPLVLALVAPVAHTHGHTPALLTVAAVLTAAVPASLVATHRNH
ncbi:MFS transporter [Micromonospora arborensis]|nr:MFS transporter [Micromonospora arborensis]